MTVSLMRIALGLTLGLVSCGDGYKDLLVTLKDTPDGTSSYEFRVRINGRSYAVPSARSDSSSHRLDLSALQDVHPPYEVLVTAAALESGGCKLAEGLASTYFVASPFTPNQATVHLARFKEGEVRCGVRVRPQGPVQITSTPPGIDCPSACDEGLAAAQRPAQLDCLVRCSADFKKGDAVTLTPSAFYAVEWFQLKSRSRGALTLPALDRSLMVHPRVAPGPCSADHICRYAPVAAGRHVLGMAAAGASGMWLVGEEGMTLYFDGDQLWEVPGPADQSYDLQGVATSRDGQVAWAVGGGGTVLRFAEGGWTAIASNTEQTLRDVYVADDAAETVWAVGDQTVLRFQQKGTLRTAFPVTAGSGYTSVWGKTATDVWLVAEKSGAPVLQHLEGGNLVNYSTATGRRLYKVWGSGDTVWVAGAERVAEKFNRRLDPGFVAQTLPSAIPTQTTMRALWGSHLSDIWVGGDGGAVAHFDGSGWSAATVPTDVTTGGTTGTGVTLVATADGQILRRSGSGFVSADGLPFDLTSIWAAEGSDRLWGLGGGQILSSQGGRWTVEVANAGPLRRIVGRAKDDIWAVGEGGVMFHYDGNAWEPRSGPQGVTLLNVWALSTDPQVVWVVGEKGQAFRLVGTQWESINTGVTTDLYGVFGRSASEVYLIAGNAGTGLTGKVLRFDGSAVVDLGVPESPPLWAAWGPPTGPVFVVGSQGTLWRYQDGQGFARISVPTTEALFDISGHTAPKSSTDPNLQSVIWVVGAKGTLLRSQNSGDTFQGTGVASRDNFFGVTVPAMSNAWFLGTSGALLRYFPIVTP